MGFEGNFVIGWIAGINRVAISYTRISRGLCAMVVRQVSNRWVGDVMAGAAEIPVAMKLGLHELVPGFGIDIRA